MEADLHAIIELISMTYYAVVFYVVLAYIYLLLYEIFGLPSYSFHFTASAFRLSALHYTLMTILSLHFKPKLSRGRLCKNSWTDRGPFEGVEALANRKHIVLATL